MKVMDKNLGLEEVQKLEGHTDRVWNVAWNPAADGVIASCSADKTVRIWEQSSLTRSWTCKLGHRLGSFDGNTCVWENFATDSESVSVLRGHESEVKSVSWNASGSLLATCGRDKSVWIWEIQPEEDDEFDTIAVLTGHSEDVKMVLWHPTMDVLFSCSYDNTIKIWCSEDEDGDYNCVQTLSELNNGHSSTVWSISFNAAGDKMVTCSDDLAVKIWKTDISRMQSGEGYVPWTHVCTLSGFHDRTIYSVHWSRDGVIASGAGDDTIQLFVDSDSDSVDGPSYKLLVKKEKAHEMDVNSVQWAPDKESRLLASASDDKMVKIWKLASEP
ncbi:Transducin/WD40 repeat-like superfamily protein [Arabidopsis thaliana]|uniref:Probable cytosolic iron-sulfur protein assembly protein CIAO1 homolog n=1 Tax=Arabidopsis thaliana TaxID=3702 RepID=F4JVW1_ARATH|nr:Transducin/WD40 repeat-like superfamily protein [Arabidopsis thaliana]AEE86155.1 Transducin/WD40 repeat-like superfamily protein [Arabidopsis thaliana]|eukprot:NP_195025.5 Transducin/WD40 repeat-like superfamily protein [Arabidopsis thaliana]